MGHSLISVEPHDPHPEMMAAACAFLTPTFLVQLFSRFSNNVHIYGIFIFQMAMQPSNHPHFSSKSSVIAHVYIHIPTPKVPTPTPYLQSDRLIRKTKQKPKRLIIAFSKVVFFQKWNEGIASISFCFILKTCNKV